MIAQQNGKRVRVLAAALCIALFAACKNPVDPKTPEVPEVPNQPEVPAAPEEKTKVAFNNLENVPVTVYSDVHRLNVIAQVEAAGSKTVPAAPNPGGAAFYPTYHFDFFGIPDVAIPYDGGAIIVPITADKTNTAYIPRLESVETGSVFFKLENSSAFSVSLRQGNAEIYPLGGGGSVLAAGETAVYELAPGAASDYAVMKNTVDPLPFPASFTAFQRDMRYIFKYDGASLALQSQTPVADILFGATNAELVPGVWLDASILASTPGKQAVYTMPVESGVTYHVWWNDEKEGDDIKTLDVKVSAQYRNQTGYIFEEKDSAWNSPASFTAARSGTVVLTVKPSAPDKTGSFSIVFSRADSNPYTLAPDNAASTTALNFTFLAPVSGLTSADIAITNGTGSVTTGTLTGSAKNWSLPVTVNTPGTINVSITKPGIDSSTKTTGVGHITYTAAPDSSLNTLNINFTFSVPVSGLTSADIAITNGTGSVTTGTITGSDKNWSLPVTVNTPGTISVSITKPGIDSGTKTVSVAQVTYTAEPDSSLNTLNINFTFSVPVSGLTSADIAITNGTGGVTKGTLSGSAKNWTLPITVHTEGTADISITKAGFESGVKTVTVAKRDPVTVISGTTLDEKLRWVANNAETNMTYIILVNAAELLVPHTLSYSGRNNVTVTVKGSGATPPVISLWALGSMFTVNSGVTLTLENITLQGRSDNNAALVTVESGGALVMNTGSKLTGNTNTNTSANGGGGVFNSSDGKFIMNGGEIAGNTGTAGGGVLTKGTFQMTGGVIYGRGASAEFQNTGSSGAALSKEGGTAEYGVFSGGVFYRSGDLSATSNTIRVTNSTIAYDYITYTVAPDSTASTVSLVFTFSEGVSSLTASNITITNGTGSAVKGSTLTGSGTSWTLPITVYMAGTVNVSIANTGIEAGTKTVTVVRPITYTVAPDSTASTASLVFTFSESVSSLTASDITITNGTGSAVKGLNLISSGTSWWLPITVNTGGTVNVSVTKTGIEAGTKTVTVYNYNSTPLTNGVWANGTIASGTSAVTYSFAVTSGTSYYVWWNDSYQGNGTKTLDVMVSAQYSNGSNVFSEEDSGWSTPRSFTAASTGTVIITVMPYTAGGTGTFAVAYRTTSSRP